jgi:hypothetical protein
MSFNCNIANKKSLYYIHFDDGEKTSSTYPLWCEILVCGTTATIIHTIINNIYTVTTINGVSASCSQTSGSTTSYNYYLQLH